MMKKYLNSFLIILSLIGEKIKCIEQYKWNFHIKIEVINMSGYGFTDPLSYVDKDIDFYLSIYLST